MKFFRMNDLDMVVAEDMDTAKFFLRVSFGCEDLSDGDFEEEYLDNPYEIVGEDLDNLMVSNDDPDEKGGMDKCAFVSLKEYLVGVEKGLYDAPIVFSSEF